MRRCGVQEGTGDIKCGGDGGWVLHIMQLAGTGSQSNRAASRVGLAPGDKDAAPGGVLLP